MIDSLKAIIHRHVHHKVKNVIFFHGTNADNSRVHYIDTDITTYPPEQRINNNTVCFGTKPDYPPNQIVFFSCGSDGEYGDPGGAGVCLFKDLWSCLHGFVEDVIVAPFTGVFQ